MLAVLLAACGGAPSATPTGPAATGTAPAATATPGEATPAQSTPPPGGVIGDPCGLVTAQEWATVTGLPVTGTLDLEMSAPFAGCLYLTSENPAGTLNVSPNGGMWDLVWKSSSSGLPEVPGIGDGAVWEENTAALIVLVGDKILSLAAGSGADDLNTRLEWAKALALIAVGRL
jgi:hypothetical protein